MGKSMRFSFERAAAKCRHEHNSKTTACTHSWSAPPAVVCHHQRGTPLWISIARFRFRFARGAYPIFQKETPHKVKPLLYTYRVLLTSIHLMMRTGRVEANLVTLNESFRLSYIPDLIALKLTGPEKGILPEADLSLRQQACDRLYQTLDIASQRSHLRSPIG